MKFSIIVPIYNIEKYVEKCIQSIINQSYKDIEILLIDDGSKDSSGNICKKYAQQDDRIKYLKKENGRTFFCKKLWLKICYWRLCLVC